MQTIIEERVAPVAVVLLSIALSDEIKYRLKKSNLTSSSNATAQSLAIFAGSLVSYWNITFIGFIFSPFMLFRHNWYMIATLCAINIGYSLFSHILNDKAVIIGNKIVRATNPIMLGLSALFDFII